MRAAQAGELAELRVRLAEAEETLGAIRTGEVDAVVMAGKHGDQVFTLEGAEQDYRLLIESMNEGALMLTAEKVILYANRCFAGMVKCPLEQVIGSSFRRFLSATDRVRLRMLVKGGIKPGTKIQVVLRATTGSEMPVQISLRPLTKSGAKGVAIGMVVTDMTEVRRTEERLRALTHRVVEVQEAERGRVAMDLHDNITQMLCAVLIRSQTLAGMLPAREGMAKEEAFKLHDLLGEAAEKVEAISRNLRPGLLEHLGLTVALENLGNEFTDRTGISLKLVCGPLTARLPAATELALYRIFQEALSNVERHAHARQVIVQLKKTGKMVLLTIKDDGNGFIPGQRPGGRKGKSGLGLLSMRERASYVGGVLKATSARDAGTEIEVLVPLAG